MKEMTPEQKVRLIDMAHLTSELVAMGYTQKRNRDGDINFTIPVKKENKRVTQQLTIDDKIETIKFEELIINLLDLTKDKMDKAGTDAVTFLFNKITALKKEKETNDKLFKKYMSMVDEGKIETDGEKIIAIHD